MRLLAGRFVGAAAASIGASTDVEIRRRIAFRVARIDARIDVRIDARIDVMIKAEQSMLDRKRAECLERHREGP